jgi:hypothetical protein
MAKHERNKSIVRTQWLPASASEINLKKKKTKDELIARFFGGKLTHGAAGGLGVSLWDSPNTLITTPGTPGMALLCIHGSGSSLPVANFSQYGYYRQY